MGRKLISKEYKVTHIFADGREIDDTDFDVRRDVTEEQHQALAQAFAEVLFGAEYTIIGKEKSGIQNKYEVGKSAIEER